MQAKYEPTHEYTDDDETEEEEERRTASTRSTSTRGLKGSIEDANELGPIEDSIDGHLQICFEEAEDSGRGIMNR